MGRHEKIAWYNLAVIATSVMFFLILFFVMKDRQPLETRINASSSTFAVLAFLGFGQTLFRKADAGKGHQGLYDPELDERDMEIYRSAKLHAFSVFWFLFVSAVMGFWMYTHWRHGWEGTLTINLNADILPFLLMPCFLIIVLVHAVSTIIQHRNSIEDGNGSQGMPASNLRTLILSLFFLPFFLLVSLFIALRGDLLFAFQFATLALGSSAMVVYEIKRKQIYSEDNKLLQGCLVLGKVFNMIFTLMFFGLIIEFIIDYNKSGHLRIPSLFVLLFISLIFYRSVIADFRRYMRGRSNEKA